MASESLKGFLCNIETNYKEYAEQLHAASFYGITELAAATPQLLREEAGVPIGPAGAIVAAANATGEPSQLSWFNQHRRSQGFLPLEKKQLLK
jgi:hypothetical protein